jgi:hypothetical protein
MAILAKSSAATKSLKIAGEPRKERDYASKKATDKVAKARLAEVKDILESEERYEIVMKDLSLADVQAIHDALVSARSSWRTSEYGEVYGGKALKAGYAAGLVMSKRLARLLGKTKSAVEAIQTASKPKKRSK